ncbi:MAG UNVERIFIED_CONTAM: hypothetical protein LVR18_22165 [Planctomycetaceae bacterium]|jgi:hypothetical protein
MQYSGDLSFGSILKLDDIRAGISDFGVNFSGGVQFDGEVFIASGGAALFPGKTFSLSFTDGPDANTEAVRAALTFDGGVPAGFKFNSDRMSMTFGQYLKVSGQEILINTEAKGSEYVVSIGSIEAEIKAGPLKLGGKMKNFGITGDGNFVTKPGFGVFISADAASGESFKWPAWLPIRPTELGIQWDDLQNHPERFSLIVSAAVQGIKGIPGLTVSGAVTGIRIDMGLLMDGQFPITDIESIAVSMSGNLFGGEISAGLLGGILKLDNSGNIISSFDTTTAVADRVFFIGVEGGLTIAKKGGFKIRFAISELGPLGVEVVGELPEGILLEPISGLKLSGFSGGVQFFSSLPDVYDPEELLKPEFAPKLSSGGSQNAGDWLTKVRKQVADQYKALKSSPVAGGFFAAFLNPMVISGGAQFTLHPPKSTLKGNVEVRLSTDGKILLTGDILLLEGMKRMPARIYGNLSQIAKGNATLLLMVQDLDAGSHPVAVPLYVVIPVSPFAFQLPIQTSVEIRGAITMRYYDADGKEVDFYTGEGTATTGKIQLYSPAAEGRVGLGVMLKNRELRVKYTASPDATLDAASITDPAAELELVLPNGTVVAIPGAGVEDKSTDTVFVYKIPASVELTTGDYSVRFLADAWKDSKNKTSAAQTVMFIVTGAEAQLAGPAPGIASIASG